MLICKNFAKQRNYSLWELEFSFIPIRHKIFYGDGYSLKIGRIFSNKTDYLSQILLYNSKNITNNNKFNIEKAYTIRNQFNYHYLDIVCDEFQEIANLYNSLVNQSVIKNEININSYSAFLYLLYRFKKIAFFESAKYRIENIGLNINDSEDLIIKTLFENDIESDIITTTLWSINSYKNNYVDLLCINYPIFEIKVKNVINNLKEKQKLDNLLKFSKKKILKYSLEDLDLMSGAEFENFVSYMFNQLGYKAINTKLSGDQGIDVIATKGNTKIAIQCKCFHGSVGNHAIMEAFAGAKYYNADKCMVVTNSTFTKSARELANKNGVVLWDRQVLKEKLEEI